MTNTPATQPATLTQYILHLLEKEENREKFNTINKWEAFIASNKALQFYYDDENYTSSSFRLLQPHEQREIIRIALLSLDEFQKEIDYHNDPIADFTDILPRTLAQKYGSMLYDKSIEEIDEIFKSENIII